MEIPAVIITLFNFILSLPKILVNVVVFIIKIILKSIITIILFIINIIGNLYNIILSFIPIKNKKYFKSFTFKKGT